MLIYCVFGLATNIVSNNCKIENQCVFSIFNQLSLINKLNQPTYLSIQNYLLLAFVIFFVLLTHFIRFEVRKVIAKCDDLIDSPSDYAVMISRMPEGVT